MAVNIAIISGILLYREEFRLLLICVFSSMLFTLFIVFVNLSHKCYKVYSNLDCNSTKQCTCSKKT